MKVSIRSRHPASSGSAIAMALAAALSGSAHAEEPESLGEVEVIGVTPTHGVGLPKEKIPANVQSATAEDLERSRSADLTGFMNLNLGSVNINEAQSNALQPDVQYRGFTASPLLGLPQGMAVYVDGVRMNEVFGDTVNWDLIPQSIISSINLVSGASPLFGQNTLGGALSIETKDGFTDPGVRDEVYGGSFGRVSNDFEAGGNNGMLGGYVNVRYFDEDGWREDSPSEALNLYGSAGWHVADSEVNLNVFAGDTTLVGLGPLPVELLAQDRETYFTATDTTENQMWMVNLEGEHWFNDKILFSGNVYYRSVDSTSFNSDTTTFEECGTAGNAGLLCEENSDLGTPAEQLVLDQNGNTVSDEFTGINNSSERDQHSYGGVAQATLLHSLFNGQHENQFIVGASWDQGFVDFDSAVEASVLLPNRYTSTGSNIFIPEEAVGLSAHSRTASAYFTDTFSLTGNVALTFSGRYNATRISLSDSLGNSPELVGTHDYTRFNPAVGIAWQFTPMLNVYGGYSESSRAPTAVELSCADPDAPCRLPNAFLADPPLEQVVAKGFEGGFRGRLMERVNWQVGGFQITNVDDIVFQATGGATANQGFFANVGDTRRSGVEVGLEGTYGKVNWFLNYSYVEATFRTPFIGSSPFHPQAQDLNGDGEATEIQVEEGDRIPGVPAHTLKFGLDYALTSQLSIGGDVLFNSDQYLRGDESNQLDTVDGYAIVGVRGQYVLNRHLTAFASVENLFDTEYENFGILGESDSVFPAFTDPRFLGPGAPRGGWIGIKISM